MKQVLLRLTEDEYELLAAHASKLGVAASRTATMAVVQMLQRLRMRHYQSDPLERGHRLIFKVLDALACKLRDDTGNPLAPEDAAAVIDGARDTLKSALVDAADQETHVLPLWAESAERAGIDWDTGRGPVQTVLDVQRWAEARELELRRRAKVLAEISDDVGVSHPALPDPRMHETGIRCR